MRETFCIASGPSLTAADVDLVRRWRAAAPDRSVVVVNTTFQIAPWADVLYAMDRRWWMLHADAIRATFAGKLFAPVAVDPRLRLDVEQLEASAFYHFSNSGAGAVALAVKLGAQSVRLLGYDCKVAASGRRHWHADHPRPLTNAASLTRWWKFFDKLARHCRRSGVRVVNHSRDTALQAFPREPLETLDLAPPRGGCLMRSIRGGMGLGDAIYVQAVARHLAQRGERLRVRTEWPDVFRPLNGSVECASFTRTGVDIVAHYTTRKRQTDTTQFEDVCLTAGIREPVELRIDWKPSGSLLAAGVLERAQGRPVMLVPLMRSPMGRTDGFGASLLPKGEVMQHCVDRLRDRYHLVLVGSGRCLHPLAGVHEDLTNRTTVAELFDLASAATALLGYVSFFVPLAEALGKRGLFVWSSRGLRDWNAYVRQITPEKIIHRKDLLAHVVDDWTNEKIDGVIDGFL